MSHVTSLLPHPSNTPSWLLIREKPEWPHSLSCPGLKSWGLPPGLTSSETGDLEELAEVIASDIRDHVDLRKEMPLARSRDGSPCGVDTVPGRLPDPCNWQGFPPWCQNPTCRGSPLNNLLYLLPLVSLSPPEGPSSFPNVPFQWKPSIPSIPQTSCYMLCAVQSAHFYKPHFDTSLCQFIM